MIDPMHSLAFSIHANPGIYALLLGSGVSRTARIPTGWEITIDLVRKLADLTNQSCGSDPYRWYCKQYGKEPDYCELLDALAKTPAERMQLLRHYIEPNEEERNEGFKVPTEAHRAIAKLVMKGYIRVIITTNFDRLIETALADVGIVPTVISTPDQIRGAMPLIHTKCCVFKVHGDYLDTRIRNTPTELSAYPTEFDQFLDRIFDEFGLIVCGWSADWDIALRSAIERSVSRRFSHYWAVKDEPTDAAKRLINHRQAQVIQITDSDSFFSELERLIEALEQYSKPHPLSTSAAVESLKRYIADPKYRIRLADLINAELDRVIEVISGNSFSIQDDFKLNKETPTKLVRTYEGACETMIAMAAVGGFWIEDWHHEIWQQALVKLAVQSAKTAYNHWTIPTATLLFYSLGLGAVKAGERGLIFLGKLFGTPIYFDYQQIILAVEKLPPYCLSASGNHFANLLISTKINNPTPFNDWIHDLLESKFRFLFPNKETFSYIFDKYEILISLSYSYHVKRKGKSDWIPRGRYGYISKHNIRQHIINEIRNSLEMQGDISPYVKSGIFGNTARECIEELDLLVKKVSKWEMI